ncbi:MAG TPA: hypothetical protein VLM37_02060, partial [Fibrobacteraceae bacterium]|nr:hypothetical protein [Fibrobacteraceae bacterium]
MRPYRLSLSLIPILLGVFPLSAEEIWDASDQAGQLQGDDYDGYWYTFTDSAEGGNSTVQPWLDDQENASYDWIGEYISDSCVNSLCTEVVFGNAIDRPYAGVGVNFSDPQAESDVTGLYVCLGYRATTAWRLNLELPDEAKKTIAGDLPGWSVKKAASQTLLSKWF